MVKKVKLSKFITSGEHDHREWLHFMPEVTGLRVKGVGSKGDVLISLDDQGWFQPIDWACNYKASIRERMTRELSRAESIFSPDEMKEILEGCGILPDKVHAINVYDREEMISHCKKSNINSGMRVYDCLDYILRTKFNECDIGRQLIRVINEHPYSEV